MGGLEKRCFSRVVQARQDREVIEFAVQFLDSVEVPNRKGPEMDHLLSTLRYMSGPREL